MQHCTALGEARVILNVHLEVFKVPRAYDAAMVVVDVRRGRPARSYRRSCLYRGSEIHH